MALAKPQVHELATLLVSYCSRQSDHCHCTALGYMVFGEALYVPYLLLVQLLLGQLLVSQHSDIGSIQQWQRGGIKPVHAYK